MSRPDQTPAVQATFIDRDGEVIPQRIPTLEEVRSRLPDTPVTEAIYQRLMPLLIQGKSIEAAYSTIRREDSDPDHPWATSTPPSKTHRSR
jgi:hypothetical protein